MRRHYALSSYALTCALLNIIQILMLILIVLLINIAVLIII